MLDSLILTGVEEPEIFGILVKEKKMYLYTMDLIADGLYRLVDVQVLNLVTNFTEITQLQRTLPLLYRFKERLLRLAERLEKAELVNALGKASTPSLPIEWQRPSADAKIVVVKPK